MTSRVINPEDWAATPGRWHGEIEGTVSGAGVCLIFNSTHRVGAGPRLHRHPYPETFIIRSGRALFTVGDEQIEAKAGQILVVAADTPHKFSNLGPDLLETIDIHANDRFVIEWLE
jgi:mannose-6-phosphate isomerase-like protein (cupin superfamily)